MDSKFYINSLLLFYLVFFISLNSRAIEANNPELKVIDSSYIQLIETKDGSNFNGRIIKFNDNELEFETEFGLLTIPLINIESIETIAITVSHDNKYYFSNPNLTRLYFSPTGRMLKKGQGYFTDIYLFFPGFAYGITDNITIGGGVSIFPGVDMNEQLFYFTPKIGISSSDNTSFSLAGFFMKIPYDDQTVGILYGVSTFGPPNSSFTIGLGYGYNDGELADRPAILLGGDFRMSKSTSFVTENWVMPGVDYPLLSYGIRFMGKRMSFDLSFFTIADNDIIIPGIPYIDFVYNF